MATHSFTTTTEQDAVIAYVLRLRNAERAAQNLEPIDLQDLIDQYLVMVVTEHSDAAIQDARDRLIEAYEAAEPTERDAVNLTLGLAP
jgi:hypothetical protein